MPAALTPSPAKKSTRPRAVSSVRSAATKVAANPANGKAAGPKAAAVETVAPASPKPSKARGKAGKAKARPVLVRDGFTMPEADFALIATLKARALAAHREAKKSELLRAGLRALVDLDDAALVAVLNRLEAVKTGRPKKGH